MNRGAALVTVSLLFGVLTAVAQTWDERDPELRLREDLTSPGIDRDTQRATPDTGAVWRGVIRYRHTWNDGGAKGESLAVAHLQLVEALQQPIPDPRAPLGKPVLAMISLVHDGSTVEEDYDAIGGLGTASETRCTGNGRARISGDAGTLWKNLTGGDVAGAAGFPVPPEGAYLINAVHGLSNTDPQSFQPRCETGGMSEEYFFTAPFGQSLPYTPDARIVDHGQRIIGRARWSDTGHQYELAWSICRESDTCPPPPEATQTTASVPNRCPEPANEKALLNATLDQQKFVSDQLAAKMDEYSRLANEAREYASDFKLAIDTCNRIRDLQFLLMLLVDLGPENVGNAASLIKALGSIIVDHDATFIVEDYVTKALGIAKYWDEIKFLADKIQPGTAREQLMSCAGYNIDPVFEGAMNFVQLTEQAEPLTREINELLNDMRNRDEEELFSRWTNYQRACREYAACMGLPTASCDTLPPR